MPDAITVFENEVFGYPLGVVEDSGHRCVRRTRFPYANMESAEQAILGGATLEDNGAITRYLPWVDPDRRHLRAVRVDWGGLKAAGSADAASGDDTTLDLPMFTRVQYEHAVCTIVFADLPYDCGPGVRYPFLTLDDGSELTGIRGDATSDETTRYCVKAVRPGRDLINPPDGQFHYKDGRGNDAVVAFPFPLPIPYEEVEVCWYWVPAAAYPKSAIKDCLGKVNDATLFLPGTAFSPPPDSYAAEVMHLYSVRPEPVRLPDGSPGFNIHYHMRHRQGASPDGAAVHWNSFPNDAGNWTRVTRGTSADGFYMKARFDRLFMSEQLGFP